MHVIERLKTHFKVCFRFLKREFELAILQVTRLMIP